MRLPAGDDDSVPLIKLFGAIISVRASVAGSSSRGVTVDCRIIPRSQVTRDNNFVVIRCQDSVLLTVPSIS